jgi:hypothetical protein
MTAFRTSLALLMALPLAFACDSGPLAVDTVAGDYELVSPLGGPISSGVLILRPDLTGFYGIGGQQPGGSAWHDGNEGTWRPTNSGISFTGGPLGPLTLENRSLTGKLTSATTGTITVVFQRN